VDIMDYSDLITPTAIIEVKGDRLTDEEHKQFEAAFDRIVDSNVKDWTCYHFKIELEVYKEPKN